MFSSLNNKLLKIYTFHNLNALQKSTSITKKRFNSASALIINNEILNGTIKDANTNYLANFLFEKGIVLNRVEFVLGKKEDIVESLQRISKTRPTHDDVTYEAVAEAFQRPKLSYHQPTLDRMKTVLEARGQQMNESRKRMALYPDPCQVLSVSDRLWVPIVVVENVYIFPGVPNLFQELLTCGAKLDIWKSQKKIFKTIVYTNMFEGDFAEKLRNIQNNNTDCKLGSYPVHGADMPYKVKISIESTDEKKIEKVAAEVKKELNGFSHFPL